MMLWEQFDKNEIYVLILILIAYSAVFLLPKILTKEITILFLIWGFTNSTLFDFTIGGGLLDLYMVNDSNNYELTDLLTYVLFSTFGYFFVYFYERLNINKKRFIVYILAWTTLGLIMEYISAQMGVTHYQNGYKIQYSLVVFLIVQTTTGLYYEWIKKNQIN